MIYIVALAYIIGTRATQTGTALGTVADIVIAVAVVLSLVRDVLKWRDRHGI